MELDLTLGAGATPRSSNWSGIDRFLCILASLAPMVMRRKLPVNQYVRAHAHHAGMQIPQLV